MVFLITCYKDIKNLNNLINDILKIKDSRIYISADLKEKHFEMYKDFYTPITFFPLKIFKMLAKNNVLPPNATPVSVI